MEIRGPSRTLLHGGGGALDFHSPGGSSRKKKPMRSTPLVLACLLLASCTGTTQPQTPRPGPRAALLEAAGACATGTYAAFLTAAKALESKANAWATERTEENLTAAREAWSEAMSRWQHAELYRLGPAARPDDPGAQSLRDEIYAWPLISRCKIEEQLVSKAYQGENFTKSLINARTLSAAEFLLFFEGTDNACGSFSAINANGTWAALSADELTKRKAEYLAAVAKDVVVKGTRLVDAWSPSGGNFLGEFTKAGQTSRAYRTEAQALNALTHALFYVEIEVKDLKLGKPLGIQACTESNCAFESPWAGASTKHVVDNLDAARGLFLGCGEDDAGVSFDDWLETAGAGDLAERMTTALTHAQAAARAVDGPLEEAATADEEDVQKLYAAVKSFTDLLKTEFVSVLNLELPRTAEGDND